MKFRGMFRNVSRADAKSNGRRLVFLPNRGYHVDALATTIPMLRTACVSYGFCLTNRQRARDDANVALKRLNESPLLLKDLKESAGQGDVWVLSLDASAQKRNLIEMLRSRGVTTIGVQEGCRPSFERRYKFVDEVLVWGRHAASRFEERSTIVGSPRLEKLQSKAQRSVVKKSSNIAVINFKLLPTECADSRTKAWLDAALRAVARCGMQPLISKHFFSAEVPPQVKIYEGSIEDVLLRARVLISRPSTTIYESMVLGCQPFLFPFEEDALCEFHNPLGAFPICWNAEQLLGSMSDYLAEKATYRRSDFLSNVFDHRPREPAGDRMAEAIMARLR